MTHNSPVLCRRTGNIGTLLVLITLRQRPLHCTVYTAAPFGDSVSGLSDGGEFFLPSQRPASLLTTIPIVKIEKVSNCFCVKKLICFYLLNSVNKQIMIAVSDVVGCVRVGCKLLISHSFSFCGSGPVWSNYRIFGWLDRNAE